MSQPYFSARQNYNICLSPLMGKARIMTFPRLNGHRGPSKYCRAQLPPLTKGDWGGFGHCCLTINSPTSVLKNVFEAARTR